MFWLHGFAAVFAAFAAFALPKAVAPILIKTIPRTPDLETFRNAVYARLQAGSEQTVRAKGASSAALADCKAGRPLFRRFRLFFF